MRERKGERRPPGYVEKIRRMKEGRTRERLKDCPRYVGSSE